MVRYAKQSPNVLRVDTTTNASLLTPERSLEIIDAGLDRLNISVEGVNADQYRDFSGHKMDYQKFVDNIAFFYDHKGKCEMNIKINGDILTPEQEEEFYRTFGNITDGINVERTIEYWPKFNDMKVDFDEEVSLLGGKSKEVQVCPYVFYEMCINSNGTYSLCRFDWNHAMILDPHVSYPPTPKKIWDSITLWRFQEQFLRKERKMMTVLSCPKCGMLADPTHCISKDFQVLIEADGLAERGTFIINPEGKIVGYEVTAGNVGRNAEELLRKVQACQFVHAHGDQVCPANWKPGAETLKPSLDLVGQL